MQPNIRCCRDVQFRFHRLASRDAYSARVIRQKWGIQMPTTESDGDDALAPANRIDLENREPVRIGESSKRLLFARPTSPPRWWPRDTQDRFRWMGVLEGGAGWVLGDGDPMTKAEIIFAEDWLEIEFGSIAFKKKSVKKTPG